MPSFTDDYSNSKDENPSYSDECSNNGTSSQDDLDAMFADLEDEIANLPPAPSLEDSLTITEAEAAAMEAELDGIGIDPDAAPKAKLPVPLFGTFTPKSVKERNAQKRKSVRRDMKFSLIFQAIQGDRAGADPTRARSVYILTNTTDEGDEANTTGAVGSAANTPSIVTAAYRYPSRFIDLIADSYDTTEKHAKFAADHLRRYCPLEGAPLPAWRTPATWERLSDVGTALAYHRALTSTGNAHAFSLNLSPDMEDAARASGNAADHLRRAITRRLKAQLGTVPLLWFALEEDHKRHRLHIHGEIAFGPDQAGRVKRALRGAGGWGAKHAINLTPAPNDGWVLYALKDFAFHLPGEWFGRWRHPPYTLGFPGPFLAATQATKKLARRIYEDDRSVLTELLNEKRPWIM